MAVHVTRAGVALTVGIILVTGLIIGGFFWAKQNGEQARRDEAIKIAEQNLEDQSKTDIALNDEDKKSEENKDTSGEATEQNSSSSTSNQSNESTSSSDSTSNSGTASNQTATELPQTGPAENSLVALLAIGLVAFTGVSYWRSRQALLEAR